MSAAVIIVPGFYYQRVNYGGPIIIESESNRSNHSAAHTALLYVTICERMQIANKTQHKTRITVSACLLLVLSGTVLANVSVEYIHSSHQVMMLRRGACFITSRKHYKVN